MGAGKVALIVVAVAAGGLLAAGALAFAFGAGVAVTVVDDVLDWRVAYEHAESCGSPCAGLPQVNSFEVYDAGDLYFEVDGSHGSAGSVRVRLLDPDANVVYDRTFTSTSSGSFSDTVTVDVVASGDWVVEHAYTGFVGSLNVRASTIG